MTLAPDATQSLVETLCLVMGFVSVCVGSYLIQKAWYKELDAAEILITTIVFAFGWVVASGQILGSLGISSLTTRLLADSFYLSAALMSYSRYYPEKMRYQRTRASVGSPTLILLILTGIIISIALLIWAWVSPPPPWDAFVYHLSFPASWVKNGGIYPVTVPFGDQAGTYFPSNVELVYFWLLTYSRNDFLTNCVQCFFLLLCIASVYRLCRIAGAERSPSICAAFGVLFMPSMVHQAAAAEVDIAFSAMFLCTLYYLLRWIQSPEMKMNMIMAFISAGLFIGSKTIAIPWTIFLLVPVLLYAVRKHGLKLWMLIGVSCFFLTGSFWYFRNFLLTGNPLFPLTLRVGPYTILDGAYERSSVLNSAFHTNSISEWGRLMADCWGIPFIVLLASMAALGLFYNTSIKKKVFFQIISLSVLFLSFFVVPYNREVRFTYTAFLTGLVPLSLFLSIWRRENRKFMYLAALIIYIVNAFAPITNASLFHRQLFVYIYNIFTAAHPVYGEMIPGALTITIAAILIGGSVLYYFVSQKWSKIMSIVAMAGLLTIFISVFIQSSRYEKYKYHYYSFFIMGHSWNALHVLKPEPVRVSYTGTDLSYGLFGPLLKNNVYHTPINKHGFMMFHQCNDYVKKSGSYSLPTTDRIDFCRRDPSYETWKNKLFALDTDILYVSVLHQNDRPHLEHDREMFPIERYWADSHPDVFGLIYKNPQIRIYEVFH